MRTKLLSLALTPLVAAICLAADKVDKKPPAPDVTIKGMAFTPDPFKAKVGQTVIWQNTDDRDHTVIADDKSFKSDNLKKGDTFKFTFKKAGKYPYSCSYHPRMKATIVVAE